MAEELNADDVPSACKTICQPIVDLSNTCDIDPKESRIRDKRGDFLLVARSKEEEAIEANCICTNKSFDVESVMALCASCMQQNSDDAEGTSSETVEVESDANNFATDVEKMMRQCSFSTTSYVAAATSVVSGIQVEATKPASTGVPSTPTTQTATTDATVSATETAASNAGKLMVSIVAVTWANLMFAFFL